MYSLFLYFWIYNVWIKIVVSHLDKEIEDNLDPFSLEFVAFTFSYMKRLPTEPVSDIKSITVGMCLDKQYWNR